MPFHSHVQAFQAKIEIERALGGLCATEIAHELRRRFGDIRAALTEFFCVRNAVIAIIGRTKPREFVRVREPIEFARIDDTTAYGYAVPVHVFGRGMGNDIRAVLERTAIYGRGERVVDDEGYAVRVRRFGKFFNIQNGERGVGDRFPKHRFRVRAERRVEFFFRAVGIDERKVDAHFFHSNGEKVIRAAVKARRRHDVIAHACDIENREKGRGLSRRQQHRRRTAL